MKPTLQTTPHDPNVRERLMTAATDLFNRKGYAATSVREIVEAAGVTKPVLYYHFGNKEGLYLALFQESFAALLGLLSDVRSRAGTVRERIAYLCDQVYTFHAEHLPLVRVMYSIYYGPPQGAPPFDFDATHHAFQAQTAEILEEGIRKGELKPMPVEQAMWAVIGALNIAMEVDLCHPEQSLGREGLARLLDTILDGLAAPRPAGKRVLSPRKRSILKVTKGVRR
jgi:TetR/AcrR family transcriptional regulator